MIGNPVVEAMCAATTPSPAKVVSTHISVTRQ
jgi:hypothetical protein